MSIAKFKYADRVMYSEPDGVKYGRVISIWKQPHSQEWAYKIVPEKGRSDAFVVKTEGYITAAGPYCGVSSISLSYTVGSVDTEKNCPTCQGEWKVSHFGNKKWYDCTKCNKKKEDLVV